MTVTHDKSIVEKEKCEVEAESTSFFLIFLFDAFILLSYG